MNDNLPANYDTSVRWQQLVCAASKRVTCPMPYKELLASFLAADGAMEYIRAGLTNYNERDIYLHTPSIIKELSSKDKIELLPEMLERLRSWHGQTDTLQEAIASVPREQIVPALELALEPYFQDMEEQAVTELLILCQRIDADLTRKFAKRAYQSADRGVSEAGADNLALLHDRNKEHLEEL